MEIGPRGFAAIAGTLLATGLAGACLRPNWVVRWPRAVLALLLLVSLGAAALLVRLDPPGLRLVVDPSTEPLLPAGDPAIDTYRKALLDFGEDEVFVIAMETEDVFRHENLAALRRVSDRLSQLEDVRGVTSLVKVTSFRYVPEQDWIEVRPFIDEIPTDPAALAELRRRALADPIYRRTLVSSDGKAAALEVNFRKMTDREFIAADLDGRIRRILDAETAPGRRFYVSGRPHIKSRMYAAMSADLARLIPVALGVVAVVLAAVAGSIRGVVLPLATVAMGVLWTFGALALLERPLTVLTVLLAPTLVAVGSVYGVHVVNRWEEDAALASDPGDAARRCLEHMIVPVLIAGLTTVVGFAALMISDVPAVFEIGAVSVFGVASITLISLTGVPAALALLPLPPPGATRAGPLPPLSRAIDRALAALARLARNRSRGVIAGWTLLTLLSAAAIPRIVVDTDYLSFFEPSAEVRREFEAVNRLLAGAVPLFVVLEAPGPGYLRDPAVLRAIDALQARLDAVPGVSRTLSFLDTMKALNRAVEGGDPAEERIPDSRGAVTELFFMLPKGDAQRFVTVDQSSANIIVRTGEVGSAAMRALTGRIEEAIGSDRLPEALHVAITGNAILLDRAADGVAGRQPMTVGLAALTIFLLLALGLRSLRLGLVAMIPNVVPVIVFFGVIGLGAAPLSLPTSLIGSIALGIAIDATAHFLVRYRAERRAGAGPEEAAARCGRIVGRPIAIASLMLCLGFLSVAFSQFVTLQQFGVLTAFTMVICMLTDLMLLPAILIRGGF